MLSYNKNLKEIAKELRNHPTKVKKCLWQRIQLKHLGYKFYRQKPIGDYIADFFCPKAKLVIEIDGGYHFTEVGKGNDKVRDEYMKSFNLTVLRFSNSDVLNNTDKVLESVGKILFHSPFTKGNDPKGKKQ